MRATRTKIVATVGPKAARQEWVARLIEAGVDVFRLNFSHGDHESHASYIESIRAAARDFPDPVAILQDLQGPRIRSGALRGGRPVQLRDGQQVTLRAGDFEGDQDNVSIDYEPLARDVKPGDRILLKDGLIELEVRRVQGEEVACEVQYGGELMPRQGVNLPGVSLSIFAPTEKDIEDLRFGMDHGVDYVALSFVRSAEDIRRLKSEMRSYGGDDARLPVIAKIEKPEAVENLEQILDVSEGVMVARGDLGIELPTETVPTVQKRIIRSANLRGVPAITATQMLRSMVRSPRPTRAEASDIANAVLDGTDALMLSEETAIGHYPVKAVEMMDAIAREAESHWREGSGPDLQAHRREHRAMEHALADAACQIADSMGVRGIVPFTETGATARFVSQRRPGAPIYALTPMADTWRRLALVWGVQPVLIETFETTDEMFARAAERLLERGLVAPADTVVYVAGARARTPGGADMIKLHKF